MPTRSPPARAGKAVTIRDVAKVAGVSPITVSRALSRPELVTAETLERIRAVVARTGYVPNFLAGSLRSRRSRIVAAVFPQITNTMFVDTIQALTDRLHDEGYQLLLGFSSYEMREDELIAGILGRKPDGIFLTGISHAPETRRRLIASHLPVVEAWDLTPTPIDMLVGFSHEKAGAAMARHLVARGHRDDRAGVGQRRSRGFPPQRLHVGPRGAWHPRGRDHARRGARHVPARTGGIRGAARFRRARDRGGVQLGRAGARRDRRGAGSRHPDSRATSR